MYKPIFYKGHSAIVAYDSETYIIGDRTKKKLLWDIPLDALFFRAYAVNPVYLPVCGTNTYKSLPPDLKPYFMAIGRNCSLKSLSDAIDFAELTDRYLLVCGGTKLYEEALKTKEIQYLVETQITFDCNDLKYRNEEHMAFFNVTMPYFDHFTWRNGTRRVITSCKDPAGNYTTCSLITTILKRKE